MMDISRRTALTLGASAGIALFFPKLRAQAQELSLEGQTMPYADFRQKIQENLLRGRGEIGFEHTPPTASGSITILGMRSAENGTTSITPIGTAIQYLQKNPDVVAVESGHTHPREVYALGRSSGGFLEQKLHQMNLRSEAMMYIQLQLALEMQVRIYSRNTRHAT